MKFSFLGGFLALCFGLTAQSQVVISEISALNTYTLFDYEEDDSDWIEIVNQGGQTINLLGWSLSDSPSNPRLWSFPERELAPGGRVVVFASGKDGVFGDQSEIHTNFRLDSKGETLYLTPPSGSAFSSSSVTYPLQRAGYTYGLHPNRSGLFYLDTPTPGQANQSIEILTGILDEIVISPAGGLHEGPVTIEINATDPIAQVYFTTDYSDPTPGQSMVYSAPFEVTSTQVIRAAAFRSGYVPSPIATRNYLIDPDEKLKTLPLLTFTMDPEDLMGETGIRGTDGEGNPNAIKRGPAWERPVAIQYTDFDHPENSFSINGGIRMHGNDSQRVGGKPSFRLYFRDEYGPNNLEQLFIPESDYQKFDALVIRGGHQDNRNPFIQDELSRRLFKDMGQASSVGTFTHVMLNGHYFGYYNPVERYNVAFFQQKYDSDSDWDVLRNRTLGEGSAEPFDQLFAFVKNNDLSDSNNYREASNRLDLVNFCDYLLLNVYGSTWDWPGNNVTISHEAKPGGKVRYHVWDAEGSFGQRAEVTGDTTQIELLDGSSEESNLFLGLIKNPSFTRLFASRFREHFYEDGPLTDSHIVERFLGLRKEVLGAIPNFVPVVSFAWTPSRRHYMIAHLYQHGLIQEVSKPVTGLPPFSHTPPIEPNDSPLASDADRNGRVDSRDLDRFVEDFRVRNNKEVFGSYVLDASGWRVWCLPVGEGVRDIAFADLDRDNRPDLLSVNGNYGYLQIQKNLGGTFSKPEFVWSGLGALAIAAADLNGDGLTDVVTGNDGMTSQTLTVLLNRGNGMLERIREIEVLPIEENEFLHIRQLQLADFDGDSNLDIFVAFHSAFLGQDNAVAILFGDGAGDFTDRAYSPMGGTQLLGSSMAVVERWGQASSPPLGILLDGGKSANRFSVSGSRQIEQLQPIPNPGSFEQVALSSADMDLDGNADLVFGGGPIGTLHIMYGSEDGAFSSTQTIQIQATRPESIHIADFNSDERPDILVSNLNPTLVPASTVQIFWNLGGRTFDKGEPMNLGGEINFPDWLESSDIDNDGDIDFAVSDEINGRITLFYNESAERKNYSDFNRDGRIDFLDLGVAASEWRKGTDSSGVSN